MDKRRRLFQTILNSLILTGMIILLMGLYYAIIKAGIPYQDPPLEIQIQYAIYNGMGERLIKSGLLFIIAGIVLRFILKGIHNNKE